MKYKKSKNKRWKSNSSLNPKTNNFMMFPLIFVVSILPLITRRHEYEIGLNLYSWFSNDERFVDFFLYYKQLFFIITTIVMLVLLLYHLIHNKKYERKNLILLSLGSYGVLALVSTIFSKYRKFGFVGIFEQFESIFVILGYCILVYYIFYFIRDIKYIEVIFKYLTYSVLILSVLGITQILGHDFLMSTLGLRLITPRVIWEHLDSIGIVFGKNRVYLTLFNPNYVGIYAGLLLPLYLGLIITAKENRSRILYLLATIGLSICLIGSGSRAGIIGISIAFIFILLFYRTYIFRKHWINYIGLTALLLGVIGIVTFNYKKIEQLVILQKQVVNLEEIITGEDIQIIYKGNTLKFDYSYGEEGDVGFLIRDESDNLVNYTINEVGVFIIEDSRYIGITVAPAFYNNKFFTNITIDGVKWYFTKQEDGRFYYLNKYGKLDQIRTAESVLFTGYEKFASGRGYIWSRTIPLLKDYLILGSGADTFVLAFPQQDYVHLHNYGFGMQLLTKPHNMYLQIGIQTGVISLIAFILFYTLYFIQCIRLYWNGKYEEDGSRYGIAIFVGTISYMLMGLANDSSITVAPIFWTLIGLGISINYQIYRKRQLVIDKE